jgi:hypothetical protein
MQNKKQIILIVCAIVCHLALILNFFSYGKDLSDLYQFISSIVLFFILIRYLVIINNMDKNNEKHGILKAWRALSTLQLIGFVYYSPSNDTENNMGLMVWFSQFTLLALSCGLSYSNYSTTTRQISSPVPSIHPPS